ncbi:MAG: ATP-grasp fold amidoligase family protein [Candidatus Limivicinus sp.]
MNKYLRFISDKNFRFHYLAAKGFFNFLPDAVFIRRKYFLAYGKPLNLDKPTGFNEKLQWLKLNDRKPLYAQLADKYSVREYIAERVGEEYLVPLVGGPWSSAGQIDIASLPDQFVLKCTHDSGSVIVCSDKSNFDMKSAQERLEKRLQRNYYYGDREWQYKNIHPQIIAEEFLSCPSNTSAAPLPDVPLDPQQLQGSVGLLDYRFLCFEGQVRALILDIGVIDSSGKATASFYRNIYDRDFQLLPVRLSHANYPQAIAKPKNYQAMVQLAEQLSRGFPHLRVDMYNLDGEIKIGELTLHHGSGMSNFFDPPEWDEIFGSWLTLPKLG